MTFANYGSRQIDGYIEAANGEDLVLAEVAYRFLLNLG